MCFNLLVVSEAAVILRNIVYGINLYNTYLEIGLGIEGLYFYPSSFYPAFVFSLSL